MKTAVSIPDELFRRADALAQRSGRSRSQVYQDALVEYLQRRDPSAVTRALDELADELAAEPSDWGSAASRHRLQSSEW